MKKVYVGLLLLANLRLQGLELLGASDFTDIYNLCVLDTLDGEAQQQEW